jgi:hypothetical protein
MKTFSLDKKEQCLEILATNLLREKTEVIFSAKDAVKQD